jgi:hypothetical protein
MMGWNWIGSSRKRKALPISRPGPGIAPVGRRTAGPEQKNAKTTPCKVEWTPARSTRAALRPGHDKKNAPRLALPEATEEGTLYRVRTGCGAVKRRSYRPHEYFRPRIQAAAHPAGRRECMVEVLVVPIRSPSIPPTFRRRDTYAVDVEGLTVRCRPRAEASR